MRPDDLRALLHEHWGLPATTVAPLLGGMNSTAWQVGDDERRWAVKLVTPRDAPGFRAGLRAAAVLDAVGIPAGAPVPTRDGALSRTVPEGEIAVLGWVVGRELAGEGDEPAVIGTTLGRVHAALAGAVLPEAPPFDWIDADAEHLGVEPWVRAAVAEVLDEWASVRGAVTTWGFLHGDPAPEAFVHDDATGRCGLIDWAGGVRGPLLYDVASAAMYVGPEAAPDLVAAYAGTGSVGPAELAAGLPTMMRLRYAVQADYFARRLVEDDLTGLPDSAGNHQGLDDARRMLGG